MAVVPTSQEPASKRRVRGRAGTASGPQWPLFGRSCTRWHSVVGLRAQQGQRRVSRMPSPCHVCVPIRKLCPGTFRAVRAAATGQKSGCCGACRRQKWKGLGGHRSAGREVAVTAPAAQLALRPSAALFL